MKKIILAVAVLGFAVFAVSFSYARYGKKVSENTSGTPDGKILVSRRYSEINKIIAIDSAKKSHKKEIAGWNYDTESGVLTLSENLDDFKNPIFHIEGKPTETPEFILWDLNLEKGPVGVFLNGKAASENREYVINEKMKALTLKIPAKEMSSISITWHNNEGLSSISEMTEKEADLYAELQGAWFTENIRREIKNNPDLSDEEKRKQLEELPVNVYKIRRNANMKKLSKEAGFKVSVPKKVGDYKLVSTMLIESSVKGEVAKTVEFSYDKSDFFSRESITVTASKSDAGTNYDIQVLDYNNEKQAIEVEEFSKLFKSKI